MRWPWPRRHAGDGRRWVVLDVESSGLDTTRARLLAISAVAVHIDSDGDRSRARIAATDSFDVLLQQPQDTQPPDKHNILLHGLGVATQSQGVPPAQALQAFDAWAADAPRLGFHVGFDRAMIERAQAQQGQPRTRARWLDIEALAAVTHPQVKAQALDDWLQHFAIPCAQRHQAAADTLATAELLLRLWPALVRAGAKDFAACARMAAGRRWLVR
jgi:DNA polymerase III subunit epsilon